MYLTLFHFIYIPTALCIFLNTVYALYFPFVFLQQTAGHIGITCFQQKTVCVHRYLTSGWLAIHAFSTAVHTEECKRSFVETSYSRQPCVLLSPIRKPFTHLQRKYQGHVHSAQCCLPVIHILTYQRILKVQYLLPHYPSTPQDVHIFLP